MALSNNITAALNLIALMCSIPILSAGLWLASKPDNECIHWLRWPLVFLGIAFLLVTLAGFAGAYWKKESFLGLYLVCMFILIVLLLGLLILAFIVTRPNGAYTVPGMGFREYRLDRFSAWLRDHVTGDDEKWGRIRACLADTKICNKLGEKYVYGVDLFAAHLSPIESGCCKPPMICSNPTTWIGPSRNVASTSNPDCSIWSNDQGQLCYNCDSCKAGLLGNLRHEWRKAYIILIITLIVLICVYLIACLAYKNARAEQFFRAYK